MTIPRLVLVVAVATGLAASARAQSRTLTFTVPDPPAGGWTVIPELPGMGRAVDTVATAARRRALVQRIGNGVALIPAAHPRDLETDYLQDNDFRQHNTFFYFTQLETPDAWLLVTAGGGGPGADPDVVLFLPRRRPQQERWTGLRLGPDSTAVRLSGIATVLPVDSLDRRLFGAMARARSPLYVPLDGTTRDEERIQSLLFSGREVRNLRPIADSLRLVKDADEIRRLRIAIDVSAAGHAAGMRAVRPGMYEYQLEAVIEAAFRANGADRVGYPSIVGSGPNGTTLHYDWSRRQMRDGELVVVDAGAEWGQYTADVTRTFPVNGRFSARQKAIYDLVLGAQEAAFRAVKPGATMADLNRVARDYLRENSRELCGRQTCDAFFIHGLGHWIGMDVHDVGDYATPLAPGMVFTIEPGIYLPDEALGVRIEDCVLVTATGGEWLSTGAPRTTEEIERLMAGVGGRRR